MDFGNLAGNLLSIAKKLAPLVGPMGPAGIELAESVVKTIKETKDSLNEPDQAKLQEAQSDLEDRVNAHANKTADSLK